jgi:hypothetical protein
MILKEESLLDGYRNELDQYCEYSFDLEYEFNPSVGDAVAAIVQEGEHRRRILTSFEAISLINLRIASKVYVAAKEFERHLSPGHSPASARILENVVKICAFRWGRGISITSDMLESSLGIEMRRIIDSEGTKNNPIEGVDYCNRLCAIGCGRGDTVLSQDRAN